MNHFTKYKCFLAMAIILTSLLLLTSCSESTKSEKDIIADLQASDGFISTTAEINGYEIIKRQTDKPNKSDIIYITVEASNPEITCELSYIMQYVLYNEGWILEDVSRYYDGPWRIDGLPNEQVMSDIREYDAFVSEYETQYGNLSTETVIVTGEQYDGTFGKSVNVAYDASDVLIDYHAEYVMEYRFYEDTWQYISMTKTTSRYEPNFSPNVESTNNIMDTLHYNSYSYLRTEKDWENCTETVYYTAKITFFLGTEIYEIAIPLHFSVEDENTSMWTYRSSEIVERYQSTTDWRIKGVWSASGGKDFSQDEYDIHLEIGEIAATEDPKIFTVSALSNSIYREIAFIETGRYCCITDSYVNSTMTWVKPGTYKLEVEGIATGDNKEQTKGTFTIFLGDISHHTYGITWTGGGGYVELDSAEKQKFN